MGSAGAVTPDCAREERPLKGIPEFELSGFSEKKLREISDSSKDAMLLVR
jgi:hypothetical protein